MFGIKKILIRIILSLFCKNMTYYLGNHPFSLSGKRNRTADDQISDHRLLLFWGYRRKSENNLVHKGLNIIKRKARTTII